MPSSTQSLFNFPLHLSLLKHWKAPKTSADAKLDQQMLQAYFPSLFHVTGRHLLHSSPGEFGRFFAAIYHVAVHLASFMLQNPPDREVRAFCDELRWHVSRRSDGIATHHLKLMQLSNLIRHIIDRNEEGDSPYAEQRAALLPLDSELKKHDATVLARRLVQRILYAMVDVHAHHASFRDLWTSREYFDFTRAFGTEVRDGRLTADGRSSHVRLVQRPELYQYEVDDALTEYRAIGDAIPSSKFCQHVDIVPQASECSVCLAKIESGASENPAVVTKCGHIFHKECLTAWVNEASMPSSNACPTCRVVLCEARQCTHVSQI